MGRRDQSPCLGAKGAGHGDWVWMRARAGVFADREEAGRRLGERLREVRLEDPVVLGLPRGGVPVAFGWPGRWDAPLDVIVVRKLGVPYQPELAMGAVGEGGARVVERATWSARPASARGVRRRRAGAGRELAAPRAWRCVGTGRRWRSPVAPSWWSTTASPPGRPPGPPARWPVRMAPPGSCSRCRSACRHRRRAARCRRRRRLPGHADGSARWARVPRLRADQRRGGRPRCSAGGRLARRTPEARRRPAPGRRPRSRGSQVAPGTVRLAGQLTPPTRARLVVFAHGSGSSRLSPRNRYVRRCCTRPAWAPC